MSTLYRTKFPTMSYNRLSKNSNDWEVTFKIVCRDQPYSSGNVFRLFANYKEYQQICGFRKGGLLKISVILMTQIPRGLTKSHQQ